MDATQFGPRLRELRTAAGLDREALAKAAGLTAAGLANLEQGRTYPRWHAAVAIAQALGVSLDDFTRPAKVKKPGRGRPRKAD